MRTPHVVVGTGHRHRSGAVSDTPAATGDDQKGLLAVIAVSLTLIFGLVVARYLLATQPAEVDQ